MKTYFRQPCPVCGRPLNVPIEILGSEASCTHCSGVFTASLIEADEPNQSTKLFRNRQRPANVGRGATGFDLKRCNRIDFHTEGLCRREFA